MSPAAILLPRRPASRHAGYSPLDIPNLEYWFKADSLLGSFADGDEVTSWSDSSGGGHTATPQGAAGSRPVFKVNQRNGLPAVSFTHVTGSYFNSNADTAYTSGPGVTLFVVVNQRSGVICDLAYSNSGQGMHLRLSAARVPQLLNGSTLISAATNALGTAVGTWGIVSVDYNNVVDGTVDHFLNGAANGVTGSTTLVSSAGTLRLGGSASLLDGLMAEIIAYERVLNATERAQIHSYLQDKYGIAVSDFAP